MQRAIRRPSSRASNQIISHSSPKANFRPHELCLQSVVRERTFSPRGHCRLGEPAQPGWRVSRSAESCPIKMPQSSSFFLEENVFRLAATGTQTAVLEPRMPVMLLLFANEKKRHRFKSDLEEECVLMMTSLGRLSFSIGGGGDPYLLYCFGPQQQTRKKSKHVGKLGRPCQVWDQLALLTKVCHFY